MIKSRFYGAEGSRKEAIETIQNWLDPQKKKLGISPLLCVCGPYRIGKTFTIEYALTGIKGVPERPLQVTADRQLESIRDTVAQLTTRYLETLLGDHRDSQLAHSCLNTHMQLILDKQERQRICSNLDMPAETKNLIGKLERTIIDNMSQQMGQTRGGLKTSKLPELYSKYDEVLMANTIMEAVRILVDCLRILDYKRWVLILESRDGIRIEPRVRTAVRAVKGHILVELSSEPLEADNPVHGSSSQDSTDRILATRIEALRHEEALALVQETQLTTSNGTQSFLHESLANLVIERMGYHPFFLQELCGRLRQRYTELAHLEMEDLIETCSYELRKGFKNQIEALLRTLGDNDRDSLSRWVRGERIPRGFKELLGTKSGVAFQDNMGQWQAAKHIQEYLYPDTLQGGMLVDAQTTIELAAITTWLSPYIMEGFRGFTKGVGEGLGKGLTNRLWDLIREAPHKATPDEREELTSTPAEHSERIGQLVVAAAHDSPQEAQEIVQQFRPALSTLLNSQAVQFEDIQRIYQQLRMRSRDYGSSRMDQVDFLIGWVGTPERLEQLLKAISVVRADLLRGQ